MKKKSSENFEDRKTFFRESLKKHFMAAKFANAALPIFGTGGAPQQTQIYRRSAADTMTSGHRSSPN